MYGMCVFNSRDFVWGKNPSEFAYAKNLVRHSSYKVPPGETESGGKNGAIGGEGHGGWPRWRFGGPAGDRAIRLR